jgi:hypothetical protein
MMSHKVVMEEPRLMGARGQPGPEGERRARMQPRVRHKSARTLPKMTAACNGCDNFTTTQPNEAF